MLTLKQPTPEVKPAILSGCGLILTGKVGLSIAVLLGKALDNKGFKPLLREALVFIIIFIP